MKKTKLISLVLVCVTALSFTKQQTDNSLARVTKVNNKLVFSHNEPISEYEQSFTFENKIPLCKNLKETMAISVQNANQEAGNQSRTYDAIIITNGVRDIAILWKDKEKDNAIARVSRSEGKYVFEGCEPLTNYDVAGKHDVSGALQQLALGTCPTQSDKISKLIRRAEKSKQIFDAVIYGMGEVDLAIKFK